MLNVVPIVLQAAAWPLIGAAIILAFGRVLPNWLRRFLAALSALASLLTLRSITPGEASSLAAITWDPLTLFRMGPALEPHGLGLLIGQVLAGLTAAGTLALRANHQDGGRTSWHGLMLLALAGSLAMTLAGNLPALTLGSGLLTLAIVALAAGSSDPATSRGWHPLVLALPGLAATLLLFLAAIHMDAYVGHSSLFGRRPYEPALVLACGAGLLWVLTAVVRPASRPEQAITVLLPVGTGLYVVSQVQALLSTSEGPGWLPWAGWILLLAGSLLAWLKRRWSGLAVQQLGLAIGYGWLFGGSQPSGILPWPVVTMVLALGILAIGWDAESNEPPPSPGSSRQVPDRLRASVAPYWLLARTWLQSRTAFVERWRTSWAGRHQAALAPAIALASILGLPFTAGATGRWRLYGEILYRGEGLMLIVALAADTLLSAAVWSLLWSTIKAAGQRRLPARSLLAMIALALPLLVWGVAPETLARGSGLAGPSSDVSAWGLGFLFILPWLVGAWLAYTDAHTADRLDPLRRLTASDWPYRTTTWLGRNVVGGIYWLGQVGEGEGWWGWALVLLALGSLFLTVR